MDNRITPKPPEPTVKPGPESIVKEAEKVQLPSDDNPACSLARTKREVMKLREAGYKVELTFEGKNVFEPEKA